MKSVCCFVLGIFSLWLFNFSQFHCVRVCFTALCLELLLVSFSEYIQDVSSNSIGFCFFFSVSVLICSLFVYCHFCANQFYQCFPPNKSKQMPSIWLKSKAMCWAINTCIAYIYMQLSTLFNYVQLGGKNQSWWKIDPKTRLSTPWNCIYILPANANDHSTATNA